MSEAEFLNNEMAQDALIRNIEVLGEAANNIRQNYSEFALKHSCVPWDDVYLMRNRVAHGYFSVDLDIVWKTVQHDLPDLEQQILQLRQDLERETPGPGDTTAD